MSLLLGLAPSLLEWLPHILAGLGGGLGLLGLFPALRPILAWAPWVLVGLCILGLLWYRGEYKGCVAARADDQRQATEAVLEQQRAAARLSDELIIAQASAMAVTEKTVISYVDRIRTVAAPDTACPGDPRMRLGNHGVRDLVQGGALGAPAVGGPAAAVPGSRAGAGP